MIDVQIDGMAELNKALTDLAKQYPKQVLKGCADTGLVIEGEAKKNETRIDTNNLRSSIRTNVDQDAQEVTVTAGGSGDTADVNYAVFQEFGTRYITPLLFMTRAAETGFKRLAELVKKAIDGN